MSLNISIQTIPHNTQRYPTVGDYYEAVEPMNGTNTLEVKISDMSNEDYEFLVAVHELVEQHLIKKHGITQESIDEFDMNYEAHRTPNNNSEPGNDPDAPYYWEHQFATEIEKLVAEKLGVNWNVYDKTVCEL